MTELQDKYKARYKGRKGRKKLQAIQSEIDGIHRQMGRFYTEYEEMKQIEELLQDPVVHLYFMKYLRDLDAMWSGVETYGLLRLCGKWIRQNQLDELTQPDVDQMLESLLPTGEWETLTQPLAPAAGKDGK